MRWTDQHTEHGDLTGPPGARLLGGTGGPFSPRSRTVSSATSSTMAAIRRQMAVAAEPLLFGTTPHLSEPPDLCLAHPLQGLRCCREANRHGLTRGSTTRAIARRPGGPRSD